MKNTCRCTAIIFMLLLVTPSGMSVCIKVGGKKKCVNNSDLVKCLGVAGVAAVPALLVAAGFTAGGVAAGSLAALIQSTFYGGSTGGLFAILQSLGAKAWTKANLSYVFGACANLFDVYDEDEE